MSGMTGAPPRSICARARVRTSPSEILERPNCGHRARGPILVEAVATTPSSAPGATPGWRERVGACVRPAAAAIAFTMAVAHYPPELPSWQDACRQLQHIVTALLAVWMCLYGKSKRGYKHIRTGVGPVLTYFSQATRSLRPHGLLTATTNGPKTSQSVCWHCNEAGRARY